MSANKPYTFGSSKTWDSYACILAVRPNVAIHFAHLDDLVQTVPRFEPCCCLVIKNQKTRMLALQVTFRASFQPVDLIVHVKSKVSDHLAYIGIVLELTAVSLERYQGSGLITCCSMLSSHRASTINNEPHKKSQKSRRRDKSAVTLRSIAAG